MRRLLVGGLVALVAGAAYIALLYIFFAKVWPLLPIWANVIIVIALAVSFAVSPLLLLLRLRHPPNRR